MEMTKLLKKWEAIDGEHQHFIADGIIDTKRWNSVPRKVLFLLKEAYDSREDAPDWDLCELIRDEWGGPNTKCGGPPPTGPTAYITMPTATFCKCHLHQKNMTKPPRHCSAVRW